MSGVQGAHGGHQCKTLVCFGGVFADGGGPFARIGDGAQYADRGVGYILEGARYGVVEDGANALAGRSFAVDRSLCSGRGRGRCPRTTSGRSRRGPRKAVAGSLKRARGALRSSCCTRASDRPDYASEHGGRWGWGQLFGVRPCSGAHK